MTAGGGPRPQRVRVQHVEWIRDRIGQKDQEILATIGRLRLATGQQLERLHFADLPSSHRSRSRRRVLRRLADWRVLLPLERRVGGARAGSAGLVYALDSAGLWLANVGSRAAGDDAAVRRPGEPSRQLLAHTLGLSELYTQLRELERGGELRLVEFVTEPGCWWPNGIGSWIKPDAYAVVAAETVTDHWWLEQDMATESLPTLRKKLTAYLDFVRRGQRGPGGVIPRVLVMVPSEARQTAVEHLLTQLLEPASKLLRVCVHERAAAFIGEVLRE